MGTIGIILLCLGVFFVVAGVLRHSIDKDKRRIEHERKMLLQRIIQVYVFCDIMYTKYGYCPGIELPLIEEMVVDSKPLTAANYVNADKIINLN